MAQSRKIEVICHRGAKQVAPENTYAAVRQCIEWGVDAVEVDVNLSRDGVFFVVYGQDLARTTNSRELLADLDAQEIDALDAGSWFAPVFAGERVPRLDEFLAWARGKIKVVLAVGRVAAAAQLANLVQVARNLGMAEECTFAFEDADLAREFRRIAPDLSLRVTVTNAAQVIQAHETLAATVVEVAVKDLSRSLMEAARARSLRVQVVYFGNEQPALARIVRWGVDAVKVDDGARFLEVLAAEQGQAGVLPLPPVKRVLFFMLDGCRPEAWLSDQVATPTLDRLRAEGVWTARAQSVMPTITLPCHTTIFHSQPPEVHGVVNNVWTPGPRLAPSLLQVLHDAGCETAMVYTWEQLRDLAPPGSLDTALLRKLSYAAYAEICETAPALVARLKPNFSFIYLEGTDALGHLYGWMSPAYLRGLELADQVIGATMAALADRGELDETLILVMADHGGHGRGHGTDCAEDMTIPWLVWGAGVRQGIELDGLVTLEDVAPTLAYALGVDAPPTWQGRVIREVFVGE